MTKQKQSELPFKINYELLHSTTSVYIWNDNKQIAIVHGNNYAEAQANAEFIVRACNNHYQLLEALKECYNGWIKETCEFLSAEERSKICKQVKEVLLNIESEG